MVTGIEAQIYVGVVEKALNLLLGLNMAVNVRMEQTLEAVCSTAVSTLLYVCTVLCPLLVGQIRIHFQFAGSEVGVHRRQQHDILRGREVLEQGRDVVNVLEHLLNICVIQIVAALGSTNQRQAACVDSVLQNLRVVVRHVAPRANFTAVVTCDLHFVEAAPPLRLLFIVRIACREPYAPGIRSNTNFDRHSLSSIYFLEPLPKRCSAAADISSVTITLRQPTRGSWKTR